MTLNAEDKRRMHQSLTAPFPLADIHARLLNTGIRDGKPWGMATPYVRATAICQRLLDAVPFDHASSIEVIGEAHIKMRLTIAGVTHEEIGEPSAGKGDKLKSATSDALKRAAMRFGIGLDLKAIPPLYVTEPTYLDVIGRDKVVLTREGEAALTKQFHKLIWKHYEQRGIDTAKMQEYLRGLDEQAQHQIAGQAAPATPAAPAAPAPQPAPAPPTAATPPVEPETPPAPATTPQGTIDALYDEYGQHVVEFVLRRRDFPKANGRWQIPASEWGGVVMQVKASAHGGRPQRRSA